MAVRAPCPLHSARFTTTEKKKKKAHHHNHSSLPPLPPPPTQAKLAAPFIAVPAVLGMAIGSLTKRGVDGFYRTLAKPAWTPPNALFPLAWSALYVAMGTAAYLATAAGVGPDALTLYRVQLGLNLAWSPIFFLAQDLSGAAVVILALDVVAAATGRRFAAVSVRAGQLWAPYLAWLLYATALTVKLWIDNPAARAGPWRGGRPAGRARRA